MADDTVLQVTGMTCSGCANAVTQVLSAVPGVERAIVDLENGRAHVQGTASPDALAAAMATAPPPDNRVAAGVRIMPHDEPRTGQHGSVIPAPPSREDLDQVSREQALISDEWADPSPEDEAPSHSRERDASA